MDAKRNPFCIWTAYLCCYLISLAMFIRLSKNFSYLINDRSSISLHEIYQYFLLQYRRSQSYVVTRCRLAETDVLDFAFCPYKSEQVSLICVLALIKSTSSCYSEIVGLISLFEIGFILKVGQRRFKILSIPNKILKDI